MGGLLLSGVRQSELPRHAGNAEQAMRDTGDASLAERSFRYGPDSRKAIAGDSITF